MRLWGENGVQSTSQHLAGHPKKRWLGMTEVQLTASGGSSSTRHAFAPSAPPSPLPSGKSWRRGAEAALGTKSKGVLSTFHTPCAPPVGEKPRRESGVQQDEQFMWGRRGWKRGGIGEESHVILSQTGIFFSF